MVSIPVSAGGPPAGAYAAKFVSVDSTNHEKYGPGLAWTFEIVGGAQAGAKGMRTTAVRATKKNSCGKIVSGLLGRAQAALAVGADLGVEVEKCFGKIYMIVVEATDTGGTRVGSVLPAPK